MHFLSVLKPLEDLEASVMRLYLWMADGFSLDQEARRVFEKMAAEEKSHVAMVRYEKRLVSQNPAQFGEVDCDLSEVRALTAQAEEIVAAGKHLTVPAAIAVALRFERSAAESHTRSACKVANPNLAKLLTALGSQDKNHLNDLIAFAHKRGVPTDAS